MPSDRKMKVNELAGKPAPRSLLPDISRLLAAYHDLRPDPSVPGQRVSFGTSGHRGSSLELSFNENHILAICQAIAEFRKTKGVDGPLFVGRDTHALSEPALTTAIEVFAAHGVRLLLPKGSPYVPTPLVSHAILTHNRGRRKGLADGIVITPSHNPPEDGGFKYNPPEGGPADAETTGAIEKRANDLLDSGLKDVRRIQYARALKAETTGEFDFIAPYVDALADIIDMEAVAGAGLKIGADPLGGSSIDVWDPIVHRYGISIEVVNRTVDPTFSFMTVDWDGKIRMDCSSPYAMAGLIGLKDRFDVAFGNDTDADRHGIVTRSAGLLNPNFYLAVAVWYLFQNREMWPAGTSVGKTLVSSSMIDRVSASLGLRVCEVPVGFKWFVEGLLDGSLGFCGEESAGAAFLRRDGTVWTTDKDGIIADLLACEMTARSGRDPGELYQGLVKEFGRPYYRRVDAPATSRQKKILKELSPDNVVVRELAGEPVRAVLTRAPGNGAPIGGIKVVAENGWFAARPSGTEDISKLYAESFLGENHLDQILEEARGIIVEAYASAGAQ
jgi:phosphoglucomutase